MIKLILWLIVGMTFHSPSFFQAENVVKKPDDLAELRESMEKSIKQQREHEWKNYQCCLNLLTIPDGKVKTNRFLSLAADMHEYVYKYKNGSLTIGEEYDISGYYEPDISIPELHGQLIEADFKYVGAHPEPECLNPDHENFCRNPSLCNSCTYSVTFEFHDRPQALLVTGYPVYKVVMKFKAAELISVKAYLRAIK